MFGSSLRRLREAAGLSQEALAERAGMSARGISDLERGLSRAPRLQTLSRLADALGLDQSDRQGLLRASGRLTDSDPAASASDRRATQPSVGGLPAYLTPALGREREVAALGRLLSRDDVHLVTLVGPGGVGKTRLAVHMATSHAAEFPDGVAFAGLAPLRDPELVLATIGQAVGVSESDTSTLAESIVVALRARRMLLVVDNCEHVLEAAPTVADLLRRCPGVRVLATSRSRLRLQGEHAFPVRPLSLPSGDTVAEINTAWSAVSLFVDRAQAVRPDFLLADDNVRDVVTICRRLDGLPLALELAAAAIAFLPVATLRERLEQQLPISGAGPRDAPPRHRTVQATVAWSYDLLAEEDRRLLRWLSVFRGGWTLALAEEVCGVDGTLEGLASLVEHSLVQPAEDVDGEPRFDMLVTIAAHAFEQLVASGEQSTAQRAHARAMRRLVEDAEPFLVSAQRAPWRRRLDLELDNIRAAVSWTVSPDGDREIGGCIVGSLAWYWYLRGIMREGAAWAEDLLRLLDPDAPTPGRARALMARGGVGIMLGEAEVARGPLTQSVALLRSEDNKRRLAHAMSLLGLTLTALDEPSAALDLYDEAIVVARAIGDQWLEAYDLTNQGAALKLLGDATAASALFRWSLELFLQLEDAWGQAIALRAAAALAVEQGEDVAAHDLYQRSVLLFRETADARGLAQALLSLGKVELRVGQPGHAETILVESLEGWRDVGIAAGVVRCLAGLAAVAAALGEAERAVRLYSASVALGVRLAVEFAETDESDRERALDQARGSLGDVRFAAAWHDGESLSLERAMDEALRRSREPERTP